MSRAAAYEGAEVTAMGFFEMLVTGVVVSAAMQILDESEDAYEVVEMAGEYAELWPTDGSLHPALG